MGVPSQRPPDDDATLPSIVLREADTDRARQAYWSAAIICAVGAIALALFDGPPALGPLAIVLVVLAGTVCAIIAWRHRDGTLFSDLEATVLGLMLSVAALAACAHIGPFSAAPMAVIVLVIVLAMGNVARGRRIFVFLIVGYVVLGALVVVGWLPAVTPMVATARTFDNAVAAGVVSVVIAVSYGFGRTARRTTTEALVSLQRARLAIAGKEALLHEARADLERWREGRHGRLSGTQLVDYRLFELLGRGGNGEVYRGLNTKSNLPVAVKVLHPNLISEDTLVDRFFREARVAASLTSSHLVRVHELGLGPEGAPFIVMEMLEGQSLAELLRSEGTLSLPAVGTLVEHVAQGLAAAHASGIVHRDIKPGNLLRTEERGQVTWKIVDFGISKLMAGTGTLTQGALLGTPGYMAPEQVNGLDVDERADVFGLGAVVYRAVTGRPPFSGPDPIAVALRSTQQQPLRPSALQKLPHDVDDVLGLALAKDPHERLASATLFAEAFLSASEGRLSETLRERAQQVLTRRPWADAVPTSISTVVEDPTVRLEE